MSPCVFKRLFAGHILKQRRLDNSASGSFEWSQQSWVFGLACLLVSSLLLLERYCFKKPLVAFVFSTSCWTGKTGQMRQVVYAITAALDWMDIPESL